MPHEVSGPLGISYGEAVSILTALQISGLTQNYILIYHSCEPDLVMMYRNFESGFPSLPLVCENCQEEVEDNSDLSFGLMAISNSPIQFV